MGRNVFKKIASAVNKVLNPAHAARVAAHNAKEEAIASLTAQRQTEYLKLDQQFADLRKELEEQRKQIAQRMLTDPNKAITDINEQLQLLSKVHAVIKACIAGNNLDSIEEIHKIITDNPLLTIKDFLFCDPIGIAITFGNNHVANLLLDRFEKHIDPFSHNVTGGTMATSLRFCNDPALAHRIILLDHTFIAKQYIQQQIDEIDPIWGIKELLANYNEFVIYHDLSSPKHGYDPLTYHLHEYNKAINASQQELAYEHYVIIDTLLAAGVTVCYPDAYDNVALNMLIELQKPELLEHIFTQKVHIPYAQLEFVLNLAIAKGNQRIIDIIKFVMFKTYYGFGNGDVNTAVSINYQYAPLTAAITYHDTDMVLTLLNLYAAVNQCDFSGYAPIHAAIKSSNLAALKLLVSHGADIHQPFTKASRADAKPLSPLALAKRYSFNAGVKYLSLTTQVAAFVKPYVNEHWRKPLYCEYNFINIAELAVEHANKAVLSWLQQSGFNFNSKIYDTSTIPYRNSTLLIKATKQLNIALVKQLLSECGAATSDEVIQIAETQYAHAHKNATHRNMARSVSADGKLSYPEKELLDLLTTWHKIDADNTYKYDTGTWSMIPATVNILQQAKLNVDSISNGATLCQTSLQSLQALAPTYQQTTKRSTAHSHIKRFLSMYQRDNIWIEKDNLQLVQQQLTPAIKSLLITAGAIVATADRDYILREFYPGIDTEQALWQLSTRINERHCLVGKIFIIASAMHRLNCLHAAGLTTERAAASHFIINPQDATCKIVGFKFIRPFTIKHANLAVQQLCNSYLELATDLPLELQAQLTAMASNPDYTQLENFSTTLLANITANIISTPKFGHQALLKQELVVTNNLTAALRAVTDSDAINTNLNANIIKRYVREPALLIPAYVPAALRHLILILRQEQVPNLDKLLQNLSAVHYVDNGVPYQVQHEIMPQENIYAAILAGLQSIFPDDLEVQTSSVHSLRLKTENYFKNQQLAATTTTDAVDPVTEFLATICYQYKISLQFLFHTGIKQFNPLAATQNLCIAQEDGKFYILKPVDITSLSPKTQAIINTYYTQHTKTAAADSISADFTAIEKLLPDDPDGLLSVISCMLQADKKPKKLTALHKGDIVTSAKTLRQYLQHDFGENRLAKATSYFNIQIDVYRENPAGTHSYMDNTGKLLNLLKIISYKPVNRDNNKPALRTVSLLKVGTGKNKKYIGLQVDNQQCWLLPPDYKSDAMLKQLQPRRHYLLPASHASRHLIESANKQHTIVHAVGPVVCQSNIYLTKDSGQDIILIESEDNNYSNEYLLSASAELNKTYNFEAIKLEAKTAKIPPVIAAARAGNWEELQALVQHVPLSGENPVVLTIDPTTGETLLDIVAAKAAAKTISYAAVKLCDADDAYRALCLLQHIHYQGRVRNPSVIYALAAELNQDFWIEDAAFDDIELRARYFELLKLDEVKGGLKLDPIALNILASLFKLRLCVLNDKKQLLTIYGEPDWPAMQVPGFLVANKLNLVNACLRKAKRVKLPLATLKPQEVLERIAHMSAATLEEFKPEEKQALRNNIEQNIKAAAKIVAQDGYQQWSEADSKAFIEQAKTDYMNRLPEIQEQIRQALKGDDERITKALAELDIQYPLMQKQIFDEFEILKQQAIDNISANHRRNKRKLPMKVLKSVAITGASAWLGTYLTNFFKIANTFQGAILKGFVTSSASAINQGKFDPERFVKGILGSGLGYAIGSTVNTAFSIDKDSPMHEFVQAASNSFAHSAINGEISRALPLAVLDGSIHMLSGFLAQNIAPLERNAAIMQVSEAHGITLQEAGHYFIVGTSATVCHAIKRKIMYNQNLDLSNAITDGIEAVLTHWAAEEGRRQGIAEAAKEAELKRVADANARAAAERARLEMERKEAIAKVAERAASARPDYVRKKPQNVYYPYDAEGINVGHAAEFGLGLAEGVFINTVIFRATNMKYLGTIVRGFGWLGAGAMAVQAAGLSAEFHRDNFILTEDFDNIMANPFISEDRKQTVWDESIERQRVARAEASQQKSLWQKFKDDPKIFGLNVGMFFCYDKVTGLASNPYISLRPRNPFKSVPDKRHAEYLTKITKATPGVEHIEISASGANAYENFANARELGRINANLGEDAIPYLSEVGPHNGNVYVGMQSPDGSKIWRLDWDINKGPHINWRYKYGPGKKEYYAGSVNIEKMSKDQYWEIISKFPRHKSFIGE